MIAKNAAKDYRPLAHAPGIQHRLGEPSQCRTVLRTVMIAKNVAKDYLSLAHATGIQHRLKEPSQCRTVLRTVMIAKNAAKDYRPLALALTRRASSIGSESRATLCSAEQKRCDRTNVVADKIKWYIETRFGIQSKTIQSSAINTENIARLNHSRPPLCLNSK